MSKCSDSFVSIPAAKLIAMCDDTIDRIHKMRADDKEELIQSMLASSEKETKSWWFGKVLRGKRMTREEAEATFVYQSKHWEYNAYYIVRRCGGIISTARKLKNLAAHGDPVQVSGEDLDLIVW